MYTFLLGYSILTTALTVILSIYIYDEEFNKIPFLIDKINSLENYNKRLENDYNELINNMPSPSQNILIWNSILCRSLYDLYCNCAIFNGHLKFDESEFNYNYMQKSAELEKLELKTNDILKDIFVNSCNYSNYDLRDWETIQFESNYFFSKIRLMHQNSIMNEMLLREFEEHFFIANEKSNLELVLNSNKIDAPKSFNIDYRNKFNAINKYEKIKISEFKY